MSAKLTAHRTHENEEPATVALAATFEIQAVVAQDGTIVPKNTPDGKIVTKDTVDCTNENKEPAAVAVAATSEIQAVVEKDGTIVTQKTGGKDCTHNNFAKMCCTAIPSLSLRADCRANVRYACEYCCVASLTTDKEQRNDRNCGLPAEPDP